MQDGFHKSASVNEFLYAMKYDFSPREKVMRALVMCMQFGGPSKSNIVKALSGTLTASLAALTNCSQATIRDVLGFLNETHWGTWNRGKDTFRVHRDIATKEQSVDFECPELPITAEEYIVIGARVASLFEVSRERRRSKQKDDEMKAVLKKLGEMEARLAGKDQEMETKLNELLDMMRKILQGDQSAVRKAEQHLRLVKGSD